MKTGIARRFTQGKENRRESLLVHIIRNRYLYIMIVPALIHLIIFHYIPIYGISIAFKDFNIYDGITGSPWAGFKHFEIMFRHEGFHRILRNSLILSMYRMLFSFPAPIILSLLLNELRSRIFKRTVQTAIYFPHFLSWVIVGSLVIEFLSPNSGILNTIRGFFGASEPIFFLAKSSYFRGIIIISHIWKGVGWGTIIFLAAITSIDDTLYEAAKIDGASRLQCATKITLPSISTTIVVVLILSLGSILNNSFEQIFVLYNPLVYDVGDVLETYIFRVGLVGARFDFATAVGVFQSFVGMLFILTSNALVKRYNNRGIF